MSFDFTPDNAQELLKVLSPFITIFATYWTTRADMSSLVKFAVAAAITALMALLTTYAEGGFAENFWTNLVVIFTASQAMFHVLFRGITLRGLNLEAVLFPKHAVASEAAAQAVQVTKDMDTKTAQDIVNPTSTVTVEVDTKVLHSKKSAAIETPNMNL